MPVFLPLGSEAVEPQAVEPQAVEPQAVEPQAVEPQAVEPQAVEPQAVEPQAVEPQAVEPQTPVEAYAGYFVAVDRKLYEDHQPERLAAILADNPRHFVQVYQTWINKGNDLVADVNTKSPELFQRIYEGLLHPDNKASRALFTATTGVYLPSTVSGTAEAIASWGGAELSAWQAAKQLEYEAKKAAELASEQAAQREAVAAVRENFTSNKFISGADFVLLAKSLGIEPHPRTVGTILKRVDGIQISGSLQLRGRGKTSDGLTQLFHTVKLALAAIVEPAPVEPDSLKAIATAAPLQEWTERISFTDDSLTVFVKRAPIGWTTQLDKHYLSRGLVATGKTIDSRTYTRADRLEPHASRSAQTITEEKEQAALASVDTPAKLAKRLTYAVSCWADAGAEHLRSNTRLDFENKRLVSACGRYALQWQTREQPDKPESYTNQQCTLGIVRVVQLEPHTTQSAQFPGAYPIGQAVRMSTSALRSSRDYWQSQGRQPQKDRAHDAYQANLAKRGTVIDVLHNGYKVAWDDGSTSSCLKYMVDKADSVLFGQPSHASQSA